MNDFTYSIPTTVFFGKGKLSELGPALKERGDRVLMVYGGGSIKRSGLYGAVIDLFRANGLTWAELPGVDPNPRVTTVREGAKICKEQGIQMVLAVGGGSSIDCAKAVAAVARYDGDAWDLVLDGSKIREALPVFAVLTLAATGSEMDAVGVISNLETREKLVIGHPSLRPAAAVMDPTYTFSVPAAQTAAGTADIISHTLENYFTRTEGAYLQKRMAEAVLKTCIHYGPVAMREPENYDARANLMWASSWAINGLLNLGCGVAWTVHPLEHELSAFYDITHGVGLAILTPHWMRYVLDRGGEKDFAAYGVNVWGIDPSQSQRTIALQAIEATADFFQKELGLPATLREVGIGEEKLAEMAARTPTMGLDQSFCPLSAEDVLNIYRAAL